MRRHPSIGQWTFLGLLLIAVSLLGISPQAEADNNGRDLPNYAVKRDAGLT